MANANNDLTEEDAADLQFPKEPGTSICDSTSFCANCSNELILPFILCAVCNLNICTMCFSQGCEFKYHKNDHSYRIIRDDFSVFEGTDWTAKEEVTLLDALQRYGNWNLVGTELPHREVKEIKAHYDYYYLKQRGCKDLPNFNETESAHRFEPIVPYRFKMNDSEEPPRFAPNTVGYKSLAGYNPARSDFECEFDSNAEDILANLKPVDQNDPHYDMITSLQCSLIQSYNRRVQERWRWKHIIRTHGLIVLRKTYSWLHRYDLTITKTVYDKLIRFMQFYPAKDFEMLMEGLHRAGELKIKIFQLCDLRRKGITSMSDARLYLKLKQVHERCEKDLKQFQSRPQLNWRNRNKNLSEQMLSKKKFGFTPIEILGMPGYEKLSESERELCRNVRLVPIAYLELKECLIAENNKMGCLKLKTARKVLKIDVNKTRRLFDFLVQEGFISKASA